MSLPIELRDHPNRSPVVSPSGRNLYHCGACNDDTVEPADRAHNEPVLCDTCKQPCEQRFDVTIKDQHGVYFDGKCVGYAKKQKSGWVSLIAKQDDFVAEAIKCACEEQYGGTFKLQNGPYVPPELRSVYWATAGLKAPPDDLPELEEDESEDDA